MSYSYYSQVFFFPDALPEVALIQNQMGLKDLQ